MIPRSGCSNHMKGDRSKFLSLAAYSGGIVTFGYSKKGDITGIDKVGKISSYSIDNVLLADGSKHNLISISQFRDKENPICFTNYNEHCHINNNNLGKVIREGKRKGNMYIANSMQLLGTTLLVLVLLKMVLYFGINVLVMLASLLLNKLRSKELVLGLPSNKFHCDKVYNACVRDNHVKASFRSIKVWEHHKAIGTHPYGFVWPHESPKYE